MKAHFSSKFFMLFSFLAVVFFYCYSFYPGYMSFDSSKQYGQVLSGEWNTYSPVIMVVLWSVTNAIIEGPGGMFFFFILLYSFGVYLFLQNLKLKTWVKIIFMLAICLWPFNLMLLPHLWKDVGLMAFLSMAIGLIQLYKNSLRIAFLYCACFSLVIASLFRFESISYVSILFVYCVYLFFKHKNYKLTLFRIVFSSLAVIVFSLFLSQTIVKLTHTKKVIMWQTVALWDIAAISIQAKKVLLPEFTIGPDMQVEDLSKAYYPWSNTFLFWKTKKGMNSGLDIPYSDEEFKELFKVWLKSIRDYPREYLNHRYALSKDLFRLEDTLEKYDDMFFSRKMHGYKEEFQINNTAVNREITDKIMQFKSLPIFKGWLYILVEIGVLFILIFWRRFQSKFTLAISLSGLASAFILVFVSPSAEQRYLIWLINSTLFTIPLLLQNTEKKSSNSKSPITD